MQIELRQLIGNVRDPRIDKVRRVGRDMDFLMLNGRAVATINRVPGASIGLYPGVMLSPAEKVAISEAVAAQRGGIPPASIKEPIQVPYEVLDDEEEIVIPAVVEINDGAINE